MLDFIPLGSDSPTQYHVLHIHININTKKLMGNFVIIERDITDLKVHLLLEVLLNSLTK